MAAVSETAKFLSLGKECAVYNCSSRSYYIQNNKRKPTGNNFFHFPKEIFEIKDKYNIIKRQDGKDGFKVTKSTVVCSKHFLPSNINRPSWGTRHSLKKGLSPILHDWNNFGSNLTQARKEPTLRSIINTTPAKKRKNFFDENKENNYSKILTPDKIDFEMSSSKMKESINNPLKEFDIENETLKIELVKVRPELAAPKQNIKNTECDTSKSFDQYVLQNDKLCNHNTGFPTNIILQAVFEYLDPGESGENVVLYNSQKAKEDETRGRKRMFTTMQSFILTLVRLRKDFDVHHLAYLFRVSEGTVTNIFITRINFMYVKFGSICVWTSSLAVKQKLPHSLKEKFPNVRCIIDCVEFIFAVLSSLILHKILYSDCKSHTTVKVLVGIVPGVGLSFFPSVFPGIISDKNITVKSGLLNPDLWEPGSELMADRGFTVGEYLTPLGVKLIIPSFSKGRSQFNEQEIVKIQQIPDERIYVERMIQRLKCYHIFDRVIPLNIIGS